MKRRFGAGLLVLRRRFMRPKGISLPWLMKYPQRDLNPCLQDENLVS